MCHLKMSLQGLVIFVEGEFISIRARITEIVLLAQMFLHSFFIKKVLLAKLHQSISYTTIRMKKHQIPKLIKVSVWLMILQCLIRIQLMFLKYTSFTIHTNVTKSPSNYHKYLLCFSFKCFFRNAMDGNPLAYSHLGTKHRYYVNFSKWFLADSPSNKILLECFDLMSLRDLIWLKVAPYLSVMTRRSRCYLQMGHDWSLVTTWSL